MFFSERRAAHTIRLGCTGTGFSGRTGLQSPWIVEELISEEEVISSAQPSLSSSSPLCTSRRPSLAGWSGRRHGSEPALWACFISYRSSKPITEFTLVRSNCKTNSCGTKKQGRNGGAPSNTVSLGRRAQRRGKRADTPVVSVQSDLFGCLLKSEALFKISPTTVLGLSSIPSLQVSPTVSNCMEFHSLIFHVNFIKISNHLWECLL